MLRPTCLLAAFVLGLGTAPSGVCAKGPVYIDPAHTDVDYALQGEYAGELVTDNGNVKLGVQVIALGEGKFRSVAYIGGLPGAGWNGEERHSVEGQREGDKIIFDSEQGRGEIHEGTMLVIDKASNRAAKLLKVERKSPTLGKAPPEGSVVLFDGSGTDAWKEGRMSDDKLLLPGTTTKENFGSIQLHLEFRTPYQPQDQGQARGNSGVYLQGRYEVQMLDSFGLEGKDNECGGLYSVKAPSVNMCLPPLTWQTYDVDYTAAKFDDQGKVQSPPRITVRHNGVVIHQDVELPAERSTTAAPVKPGPEPGPIYLQDHGNPVRYRNIWLIKK